VRIRIVRRRGEGAELGTCSYLGQCDTTGGVIVIADNREHRIQSRRSRVLVSNRPCRQGSLATARPTKGPWFGVGVRGTGWAAHDEALRSSEEG